MRILRSREMGGIVSLGFTIPLLIIFVYDHFLLLFLPTTPHLTDEMIMALYTKICTMCDKLKNGRVILAVSLLPFCIAKQKMCL